jgi:hypothetical protein
VRPRTRTIASLLALFLPGLGVLLLAGASPAQAQARAYRGPHPLDLDGHWHLEDTVHVHGELAVGFDPFGDVDGVLVVLGDPVAFGYEGDAWTYRGAHPLPGGLRGYCGLGGEHRHPFAPEGAFRREDDGVHVYVGAMRGGIEMVRPGRVMPRHPIVTGPLVASRPTPGTLAPFFFGGCMHQWIWGSTSRPVAVPYAGCLPTTPFRGGHAARGRARVRDATPRPPPAPPVESTVYSRVTSRPAVGVSRGRSTQRNDP